MEKTHRITLNNKSTYEAIGKLNSAHCRRVANDEGMKFTSVTDAAEYAGVSATYMCRHLNDKAKTVNGHVYFYIDKRDESFDAVMNCLARNSAEVKRRKADEEDARKWREYQAELEAKRKAEEKRIEDERKAKEQHEAAVAKAAATIERRRKMCARITQQLNKAHDLLMKAEREYEELTGETYGEETEVEVA